MRDPFQQFEGIDPSLKGDGGNRTDDRVDEMWAYLAIDEDDNCEGIIGAPIAGQTFPLVGADRRRMLSLREGAQFVADVSGMRVELVRFSRREHVEWIEPRSTTG